MFFYFDLTKDFLKKKYINQAIDYYIEEKNKINLRGHYSILIFQEEGNPIFITNKKDSGIITKVIDENWKSRPRKQSFFENGLFYIFSYIAETIRKKSKFNRVIVITDTPSDLNDSYQEALFNLVSKIKHFPTFIDIIRVSDKDTRFFKDDVKLNVLASDTKGGIFYTNDKSEFKKIFEKLIKSKQLVTTFADQPDQIKISQEDYAFYSRLAKPLKPELDENNEQLVCYFCGENTCPVCLSESGMPLLKCEDCGTLFHSCCATNFTINHNIGIPHIWRCPQCDVLLQISEDDIIDIDSSESSEFTSVKEYIGFEDLQEIPMDGYDDDAPHIIDSDFDKKEPKLKVEFDLPVPSKKLTSIPTLLKETLPSPEGNKKIRIGGFFGKVYSVKKVGDKLVYEKINRSDSSYKAEVNIETSKQSTLSTIPSETNKGRRNSRVKICPQCGVPISSQQGKKCTNCGFVLSED